jgi:hypothetical protein
VLPGIHPLYPAGRPGSPTVLSSGTTSQRPPVTRPTHGLALADDRNDSRRTRTAEIRNDHRDSLSSPGRSAQRSAVRSEVDLGDVEDQMMDCAMAHAWPKERETKRFPT